MMIATGVAMDVSVVWINRKNCVKAVIDFRIIFNILGNAGA